jgi:hypothetical protein
MAFYIHEINEIEDASAYYGPFPENELDERINDNYAEALAMLGGDLEVVELTDEDVKDLYVNPPSFWTEQLRRLTE